MNQKLIFLDIDGTLCVPGSNVPPTSALEAIRKARAAGHLVFLCTGRNLGMLSPLLGYGFDGVVGSSGGYVTCGDTVIYDCPMTPEQQETAMEVLNRNGVFRTVECRDRSYTDEGFKEFLKEKARRDSNSEVLRWREQIEKDLGILPMAAYKGDPIYKMVLMCEDRTQLDEPVAVLSNDFAIVIQDDTSKGYVNGEMVLRCFDKGQAIRRVCDHFGLPLSDTFGYGDSMNDLEMIEVVGHSVVMANGSDTLKAMADEVCPAVADDGLYASFRRNGLI